MDVTLKLSSVFRERTEVCKWIYLYSSVCDYEMYILGSLILKVFSKRNDSMFLCTQIGAHAHTEKLVHSFRKQIPNREVKLFL